MEGETRQDVASTEGIDVRYGLDALRRDWRRCSLSSDFVGTASCEPRFAQRLISTAVNELLELVFRLGADGSAANLNVRSEGERATIVLDLPLSAQRRHDLQARLDDIMRSGPQQVYLQQLGAEAEPEPLFGVLQLMVDFSATLSHEALPAGLRLRLNVNLAGGSS